MPATMPTTIKHMISVLHAGIRADEITAENIARFADAVEESIHETSAAPLRSVARHHRVKAVQAKAQIRKLYEHYPWLHDDEAAQP